MKPLSFKAIDRADTLREELYAVISEIPSKMSNVHHLVDVYKKGNAALHKSADAVYVAMFSLLTIVINRLSKGVARESRWKTHIERRLR